MVDIKTLPLKVEYVGHVTKPKAHWMTPRPVAPSAEDVFHSLLMDASAADENFDDWCANYGYSDDSIAALNVYKACLQTATQLRKHLGREVLADLRELLKDH